MKASTTPSKVIAIATDYQSEYQIDISWTEPENGGSVITDYKVYWDNASGTFVELAASTAGQA